MTTITKDEYKRKLTDFFYEEKAKLPPEKVPYGQMANWWFWDKCEKALKRKLRKEKITIE